MRRKPIVEENSILGDTINMLAFRRVYREPKQKVQQHNYYTDMMEIDGTNRLFCQCGEQLFPDSDMSRVSINQCFKEHKNGQSSSQSKS